MKVWSDIGCESEKVIEDYIKVILNVGVVTDEVSEITLYPNPTSSYFYLEGETIDKVEIYDLRGLKVLGLENNGKSKVGINLEHLKDGVYIIKVIKRTGIIYERIVKQK